MNTEEGIRAVKRSEPIDPDSVRHYLEEKFAENLKAVGVAMQKLAKAYRPKELGMPTRCTSDSGPQFLKA
jgi:hypothetical protein